MVTLYGKDSKGGLRVWSCFADGDKVVVKHGKLGGKIQEKVYTAEAKNIGKANETSPEAQAQLEVEAKIVKQLKSGYFHDKEDALDFEEFTPMKAQNYNDHADKLTYPLQMQPKLNGQRLMIDKYGVAWSKQGEPLELPDHWFGVKEYAIRMGGLDGEVYAGLESQGGLSLQRIISAFRKANEDTPKLEYYIYDIPSNEKQIERTLKLEESNDFPACCRIVVGITAESEEESEDFYKMAVDAGYEGAMYRNFDGEYEFGQRSYNLLKRKPRQSAEAVVHSVTEDKNGWGVLNCKTLEGVAFKCQMKVPRSKGETNYRTYINALTLIGKSILFEYEELSDAGVPTKPVGIMIREVDQYGRPLV